MGDAVTPVALPDAAFDVDTTVDLTRLQQLPVPSSGTV
jgi:hypothetical protein